MEATPDVARKFDRLRRQAEELIQSRESPEVAPHADILELIHELRIHQAELEIQNEELKRAQQELSELHLKYERLYEFAPCGYVTLDAKGIITGVNLTGVRLLGAPRKHLLRSGLSKYIAAGWRDAYLSTRQTAAQTGENHSVELLLKSKDGPQLWVRADIQADRDENAAVLQWCIVLADISGEKAAETALLQSEDRFRTLFENAPVAYQSLDCAGNLIEVNAAWEEMTGYCRQEALGRSFSEFLPEKLRAGFNGKYAKEKSIDKILGPEFPLVRKNGEPILVAHRGKPGLDAAGRFVQTHCTLQDITGLRKAEEENKQLEDQLRQAQKLETIGTLAGGIAHDINNILTIIIGNYELINSELPAWSPVKDSLEQIRTASLRARDVVRQLLTFARKGDTRQTAMDIAAVVRESLNLVRSTIPANIDIRQHLPADIAPVLGNSTQIHQLMINLCSNAADAMLPTGGCLTIAMDNIAIDEAGARRYHRLKPGAHVRLLIEDTGCGMDAQTLEHIFEPYFTTKPLTKGTGIGLAVVHGIVEQHNGQIAVESRPGKGTVFTILLPALHDRVAEQASRQPADLPRGRERILFVDDETSIVKLNQVRLESLGYQVTATTDPLHALEMVRTDPSVFDLVVTDMAMPRMTGDVLSAELLRLRPDLPILLCTGYSENIDEASAGKIGISGFLMKPLDIKEFAVAVRKTLDTDRLSGP